jgi:hypothetical protein
MAKGLCDKRSTELSIVSVAHDWSLRSIQGNGYSYRRLHWRTTRNQQRTRGWKTDTRRRVKEERLSRNYTRVCTSSLYENDDLPVHPNPIQTKPAIRARTTPRMPYPTPFAAPGILRTLQQQNMRGTIASTPKNMAAITPFRRGASAPQALARCETFPRAAFP